MSQGRTGFKSENEINKFQREPKKENFPIFKKRSRANMEKKKEQEIPAAHRALEVEDAGDVVRVKQILHDQHVLLPGPTCQRVAEPDPVSARDHARGQ